MYDKFGQQDEWEKKILQRHVNLYDINNEVFTPFLAALFPVLLDTISGKETSYNLANN